MHSSTEEGDEEEDQHGGQSEDEELTSQLPRNPPRNRHLQGCGTHSSRRYQ